MYSLMQTQPVLPQRSLFIHSDKRGDDIAETGTEGQTRRRNTYTEYGQTQKGSPPSPYGFLGSYGRFFDPQTSLYLLGARLYDPSLGRFLSRDPIPGGSANDYEYGAGNPVMSRDAPGTHHCRIGWCEDLFLSVYGEHHGGNWAVRWETTYGPSFLIAFLLNTEFHACNR
jgi:RHS repeat-associated protein